MMAVAAMDAGRSFRIGNVLGRAFESLIANFVFFFSITLVVALPNLLFELRPEMAETKLFQQGGYAIVLLLGLVLNTICQAVILFGAFQRLRGQPLQVGGAVQKVLARVLPLLGLAILYVLAVACGLVLVAVPGLILIVMWTVVVPACVVEGLGPVDSMRRSASLTSGHRWGIFGMMAVFFIAIAVVSGIIDVLLTPAGSTVKVFGDTIWTAAWNAYWDCVVIMTYHDLRVAKEGIDIEQIASVFD
jgi:hypothetical protein